MRATIRRYEAIDQTRSEVVKAAESRLLPRLSELSGFRGYYLIDAGDGIVTSLTLFDTAQHAEQSTRVAFDWVRAEKFEPALRQPPKVTNGDVVICQNPELMPA